MVKADLAEKLTEVSGISQKESFNIVDEMFELVKATLEKGEKVNISGFGNFELKSKSSRIGRNPQTGESITISPRRIVSFKLSSVLKARINGDRIEV